MTAINPILLAIILLAALGLAAGLILAIASIVMAVPVDEKQVKIRECLPGANCGACGFSGCDGYASALAKGEAKETNLCAPGGNEVAKQVAAVLGVEAGEVRPMAAVVLCQGHHENAPIKLDYTGLKSCRMAAQLFGGPKDCVYGCLGFGDCVEVCEFNAIHICNGVARIAERVRNALTPVRNTLSSLCLFTRQRLRFFAKTGTKALSQEKRVRSAVSAV